MSSARIRIVVLLLLGVVLAVFPIASGLIGKAQGVDNLTDALRPTFGDSRLAQTRADMDTVQAMADQFTTDVIPALADRLGVSTENLLASLNTQYPDLAAGVSQFDTILPYFQGVVGGLEAQQDNFHKADAIPTKNLPALVVPFLFLVPGLILIAFALFGLLKSSEKPAAWCAVVIGAVLVIAPLALSVPAKAQAVDDLTDAFRPAFSTAGIATTREYMNTIQAMADQLTTEAIPGLAEQLRMTVEEFVSFLGANFPKVATGVGQLGEILPRFQDLVAGVEANVDSFRKADSIPTDETPTTLLHWLFVIPGLALLGVGGVPMLIDSFARWRAIARAPSPESTRA
ncbi:MAG: hypothetical protein ACXWBO_06095 [Ilumatobacteraceae bacterium]